MTRITRMDANEKGDFEAPGSRLQTLARRAIRMGTSQAVELAELVLGGPVLAYGRPWRAFNSPIRSLAFLGQLAGGPPALRPSSARCSALFNSPAGSRRSRFADGVRGVATPDRLEKQQHGRTFNAQLSTPNVQAMQTTDPTTNLKSGRRESGNLKGRRSVLVYASGHDWHLLHQK